MNQIVLSKGLLNPNINTTLYTVPNNIAYVYCVLVLTAANGNGMMFNLWSSLNIVPQQKDLLNTYTNPALNSSDTIFNNFTKDGFLIGSGESLIINTPQTDLSYRLTGYPVPVSSNTILSIN